ncbi:MAG TPA: AraC family transcriptional regulator [Trebonia sp.]|jgi:AraC-like DNA-binding protein|nr:AraC family transcriptional regulator [Trebonia sp.]
MFERLDSRPDVLTEVLKTVQLSSVLSARATLGAPWSLHFGPVDRRAGFHVIVAGTCAASLDDPAGGTAQLGSGDVVVFPHGSGHRLSTAGWPPHQPPAEFADVVAGLRPGEPLARDIGGGGERTTVLCGSYAFAVASTTPLLHGLPEMIRLPAAAIAGSPLAAAAALLAAEADSPGSGTGVVVDRLVDLLFVYALRSWLATQATPAARAWIGALHDDVIGPALRAVHADPGHPWTVAALADQAGLSRAAFARRFHAAVGEAPLTYVRRWRMTLASERLSRGDRIAVVARLVGYENEFAFAKAFKRVRGVAPGHLRHGAETGRPVTARILPLGPPEELDRPKRKIAGQTSLDRQGAPR